MSGNGVEMQARKQKKNQESALRIMEALSGVDTMLLERSDVVIRRKRPIWQYGRTWAAVVCVAVVGVLTWRNYQFMNGADGNNFASSGNNAGGAVQMSSAVISSVEGDGEGNLGTDLMTGDDNSMEEKERLSFDSVGNAGKQDFLASDVTGDTGNQGGSSPSVAPNGTGSQGGSSPSVAPNGTGSQGGSSPSVAPNGTGSQGGSSPSVAPNENEKQEEDKILIDEACGVPLNPAEKLTEKEARDMEIFGEYIPARLPEGYGFEAAYWDEEGQKLSICWSRGLDDIHLYMEQKEDCDTIDINVPERYDVRLYEIPYGETVPQEYQQDFDNPIFTWEDFSKEIIESRVRSYEDRGDTNTPRGNFSILFPDGVLMRFSGRGTVNQIWEMFQSLGL